jgi:hypothetical protein
MTRTKKLFSTAMVLALITFFGYHAVAGEPASAPALYREATSFTVKAQSDIQVKVTFKPDGSLNNLERCFSKDDCETVDFERFKDPRELYTCVPLVNGEKAQGTKVLLKDYRSGEDKPYDCQYVTAIEATDQVMLKAGNNTSCPYFYGGRWHDPCKGR